MTLQATGECCIPGVSPDRIVDDHLERYRFAADLVRGKTVLDIACGAGYGTRLLADAGAASAQGVDVSENAIDYARAHYQADNVTFRVGDICRHRTQPPFDVITCFETIEHIHDFYAALESLHALLAPDGLLLISSPNRPITSPRCRSLEDRPINIHHVREFTVDELTERLARHGLTVRADGVLGQRQQRYFRNRYLHVAYKKLCNPNGRTSPAVTPVRNRVPRYIILMAGRANGSESDS